MRAEEQLARLIVRPRCAVAGRAVPTMLVHFRDALIVLLGRWERDGGVREVEGILDFACGVLLGDEEGVEAPETGLDEGGCGHLCETESRG